MKKILFSLFTLAFSLTLTAQEIWLETGVKGGPGISFLYNQNIADDDTHNYLLTSMYGLGAKFAVNFGPNNGFTIEGLYNQSGQNMEYDNLTSNDLSNEISWKSVDAYLLYRYTSRAVFLELGPMYSIIQSVEQMDDGGGIDQNQVENFYTENYLAGVFGFGGLLFQSGTVSGGLGVRLHYGFGDFVSDAGRADGFPNPNRTTNYESIEDTTPIFAQLLFEINFGLGRFAPAGCGQRMKFYRGGRR